MKKVIVKTQAELDSIGVDDNVIIEIRDAADGIKIRKRYQKFVQVYNSIVCALDNSTVRAYDNSTVDANGNSTVCACGNSTVYAIDVDVKVGCLDGAKVIALTQYKDGGKC